MRSLCNSASKHDTKKKTRVGLLDGLKQITGKAKTVVGSMLALGRETHGGTVGTASSRLDVICTRCVLGKAHNEGTSRVVVDDLGNLCADGGVGVLKRQ